MQQIGAKIKVSSLADIKVLHRAGESPWSLPLTPLDGIIAATMSKISPPGCGPWHHHLVQAGEAVVLQSGDKSLWYPPGPVNRCKWGTLPTQRVP